MQRARNDEFFCGRCGGKLAREVWLAGTCPCMKGTTENLSGTERGLRLALHEVRRVALTNPELEARRAMLQTQLDRLAYELEKLRAESGT